ncbi:MAG: S-methyl-5'-thioadenosine phosphorylase [Chloroflexota bacterium]|nr:S-methyl-5'-thioadenosine phosphorylase [Chloroflexota bacterium]MDQ5868087.1 S-methyl-5'-thioadenosine phosphorylase [Chloroflexota bacterium]
MQTGVIGIIGGSGFYDMPGITDVRTEEIDTPFGKTLDPVVLGRIAGRDVAFISRHGKGHRVNPTHVPVRANIFAMKLLGVTHLISVSAVGSMKEELAPEHMVVPDQLFDRTVHRPRTFFEHGVVVHVAFDKPYCPDLRKSLVAAAREAGGTVHDGGTYMCVEGPQFSTRAESETYRRWGMSIIGMTALPEARLAREAEMCYATLAMVTDYDTWHPGHDSVTVEMVVQTLNKNVHLARNTVASVISTIRASRACSCGSALQSAIMTAPEAISADVKEQMRPLIGRYVD